MKISSFILIALNWHVTNGLFENCNYAQTIEAGKIFYVYSVNYPNKYPPGTSCRYLVTSPIGSQIDVQCRLEIPADQQCKSDTLYLNLQGNTSIPGSDYYCGTGELHKISLYNRVAISHVSSSYSSGGRFLCSVQTLPPSNGGSDCDCGWSVTRKIVGGVEAGINEFPSMAGIYDKSQLRIFCGAAIIHSRYLLSAAHCFYERGNQGNLAAMVGDHDFTIANDSPYTRTYDIGGILNHEQFVPETKQNDIALLRTTTDMEWNNGVGPACLPFNYDPTIVPGTKVDVAGWGTLSFGGTQPHKLQKVTLDIVQNGVCSSKVSNLYPTQLCTYTYGKDTCQYDSGGGDFFRQNRMYLVGITSYGFGCAMNLPSVSTRVSSYLQWIQTRTNANFCRK